MAPSTYYDTKTRPPSARAQRDAELGPALRQLWEDNYRVYGVRKLRKTARRVGHDVGRDQVARLMRAAGIEGVRRGKRVRTTKPDLTAARHPDLVKQKFAASAPNQLWVTDLTFVPTWAGVGGGRRALVFARSAPTSQSPRIIGQVKVERWPRHWQTCGTGHVMSEPLTAAQNASIPLKKNGFHTVTRHKADAYVDHSALQLRCLNVGLHAAILPRRRERSD